MTTAAPVYYPDSDEEPTANNTVQFDWIATLKWNAEFQFRDRPDVFVAGDHLIYPVEDDAKTRQAPDVFVAFGPPKGDRGSYKVWEEGVFPQVAIEVWSPSNKPDRMREKFEFYERFGAEEYYLVYPDYPAHVEGWVRSGAELVPVADMTAHVSGRLGWRFVTHRGRLTVAGPDGRLLRRPDDIAAERDAAERRADAERTRAETERTRADRLAAKLRALGVDPDAE
jgi:Uma2 family endonuclease